LEFVFIEIEIGKYKGKGLGIEIAGLFDGLFYCLRVVEMYDGGKLREGTIIKYLLNNVSGMGLFVKYLNIHIPE